MARADELKERAYNKTYSQLMDLMDAAVEQGNTSIAVSYKFFQENNELLKYVIDKAVEDGFFLRLYESRMEIRLSE